MVKNIYYGKKFIEKNDLKSLVKFSTKKLIQTRATVKLFEAKIYLVDVDKEAG